MGKAKIGGLVTASLVETDGIATVLFFQGCQKNCAECHNPDLIPMNGGYEVELNDLDINWAWVDYLVASGGEPLLQPEAVIQMAWIAHVNSKKLWIYTGMEFSEIDKRILDCADVIKTGGFIKEFASPSLKYRGSSNQKLFRKIDGNWKEFDS